MVTRNYSISFTTCSIRKTETLKLVALYNKQQDWNEVRRICLQENILQQRTQRSAKRLYRELASRLKCLNTEELDLLHSGAERDQDLLLWLATCRRYDFIYDFAVEVLRELVLNLQMIIQPYHFDSFWISKSIQDEDLEGVADTTKKKARQVLFKMLHEVGLVDTENRIQLVDFSQDLIEAISATNIDDLRIYPISNDLLQSLKA